MNKQNTKAPRLFRVLGEYNSQIRAFSPNARFYLLNVIPMGATPAPSADAFVDFGPWNGQKPLRLAKEFEPGRMVASDPRVISVRPDLPPEVNRTFDVGGPDVLTYAAPAPQLFACFQ